MQQQSSMSRQTVQQQLIQDNDDRIGRTRSNNKQDISCVHKSTKEGREEYNLFKDYTSITTMHAKDAAETRWETNKWEKTIGIYHGNGNFGLVGGQVSSKTFDIPG